MKRKWSKRSTRKRVRGISYTPYSRNDSEDAGEITRYISLKVDEVRVYLRVLAVWLQG